MIAKVEKRDLVATILLTIVTCGIYGLYSIYWAYQMGKKIAMAEQKRNLVVQDNSILYLILSLFGFGIVVYIIAQSDLNKLAEFDAQHA